MRVLFLFLFLLSCGNEKVIQLPEIQNAKITTITDVSPAYIFYDETKPDSVELNRKNLIISTNWLVNVDKRLTLKQALPSIIKLQDKKRKATLHKNENAKNYFTCNDTSIKNLGFIDFTDVVYVDDHVDLATITFHILFTSPDEIQITTNREKLIKTNISDLGKDLFQNKSSEEENPILFLEFNDQLSFQDYITFKSILSHLSNNDFRISPMEFIFD
ncbi:hypothetical protein [Lacinutrix sp. Hel_I_90]|uniref:hypothetical protein n=1 Tax=Lacinutrix sp. Hel_I_90 TaxID=1249999 RepID=UPI00069871CD|nr:hypothetical protein [Lacinutrix sp. Hel_I_90]